MLIRLVKQLYIHTIQIILQDVNSSKSENFRAALLSPIRPASFTPVLDLRRFRYDLCKGLMLNCFV